MSLALAGWTRHHLPPSFVGPVAGIAGDVARLLQPRRRRIALENARWLTGQSDPEYAARLFRHLIYCNADLLRLPYLSARAVLHLVDARGRDSLDILRARTSGALLVGGHLGNFELAAAALAAAGLPAAALVESIDPVRDAFFVRLRTATGLRVITADRRGAAQARKWLRDGGVLVVAGDRPLRSDRRQRVPYGDGYRELPTGPAWLALATGAMVTTGYLVRTTRLRDVPYEGLIETPVPTGDLSNDEPGVAALTRRIATRLSETAVRHADQWFVFDPGWSSVPPGDGVR